LGKTNELVVGYALYKRLGQSSQDRCESYRALFDVGFRQKRLKKYAKEPTSHGF